MTTEIRLREGVSPILPSGMFWLDGEDGQEDELDDVAKGKLQPPTPAADEVPGDVVIRPNRDAALIEEDEHDLDLESEEPVN